MMQERKLLSSAEIEKNPELTNLILGWLALHQGSAPVVEKILPLLVRLASSVQHRSVVGALPQFLIIFYRNN